jgi:5'-nucleotidase / UDP-sugar diphosphatase
MLYLPILRSLTASVVLLALLAGARTLANAEPLTLTIVPINDWDQMDGERGQGGATKTTFLVKHERARAEAGGGLAAVTFGADMISPSLPLGTDRGTRRIDFANATGIDVGVLDIHEFNFGPNILKQRVSE